MTKCKECGEQTMSLVGECERCERRRLKESSEPLTYYPPVFDTSPAPDYGSSSGDSGSSDSGSSGGDCGGGGGD